MSHVIARRAFLKGAAGGLAALARRRGRRTRSPAAGPRHHARAEVPLVRLLRQAGVRPDRPLRARHGGRLRAPLAAARRRHQGRHGRPARRRPLDRAGREPRLELAAGLHAPVAARARRPRCIWNDREGDRFVCHILDVQDAASSGRCPRRSTPLSPDGRWAVAPDFRRLNDTRPGYGYAGVPDPNRDELAPEDAGIWRIDLDTGKQTLLLSFAEVAAVPHRDAASWTGPSTGSITCSFAPDGTRFIFLHRWRGRRTEGRASRTRMFTADPDGKDLHVLDPSRQDLALHLARPAAHPGLGLAPVARRAVLPLRGPDRPGRGRRPGRDDRERPLHLPARQRSGSSTTPIPTRIGCSTRTSTTSQTGKRRAAGPLPLAAGVRRRMALRHASALQPRRHGGRHRLAARRQRPADVPDRRRRDRREGRRLRGVNPRHACQIGQRSHTIPFHILTRTRRR